MPSSLSVINYPFISLINYVKLFYAPNKLHSRPLIIYMHHLLNITQFSRHEQLRTLKFIKNKTITSLNKHNVTWFYGINEISKLSSIKNDTFDEHQTVIRSKMTFTSYAHVYFIIECIYAVSRVHISSRPLNWFQSIGARPPIPQWMQLIPLILNKVHYFIMAETPRDNVHPFNFPNVKCVQAASVLCRNGINSISLIDVAIILLNINDRLHGFTHYLEFCGTMKVRQKNHKKLNAMHCAINVWRRYGFTIVYRMWENENHMYRKITFHCLIP